MTAKTYGDLKALLDKMSPEELGQSIRLLDPNDQGTNIAELTQKGQKNKYLEINWIE